MDHEEMLDLLTEDIVTYVMQGSIREDVLAEELAFDDLDDRFDDFQRLMDLHFILQPEVVKFVRELSQNLRRVKTQTRNVSRTRRGTVDGRINWSATIQERYSTNPRDSSLFVCDNRTEEYDIDENIVLKKLLSIIHTTLQDAQDWIEDDYRWINERWREEKDLIEELSRIMERNVHVTRIKEPEQYEPTDRMITTAKDARSELYSDAAGFIEQRRRMQDGDPEKIREVLDQTAITPDDEDTLFELYVLFRFIAILLEMAEGEFTMETIRSSQQELARFRTDDGTEAKLYHDQTGERALRFIWDKQGRPEEVSEMAEKVIGNVLDGSTQDSTRRPDVLLIEVDDGEDAEYLITEVKNSSQDQTIRQGIREGLEYLAFLQRDGSFHFTEEGDHDYGIFGDEYNGLLVVQDTDTIEAGFEDQQGEHPLKVLQAGDLEDAEESPMRTVFGELLGVVEEKG